MPSPAPSLLVADLFDPPEGASATPPPGLAALLARGRPRSAAAHPGQALARLFGLSGGAAPYLLAAAGHPPGEAVWMRLDPVHLAFHQDCLFLAQGEDLALEAAEDAALVASLKGHYADAGLDIVAPRPGQWYARLAEAPALDCTPLEEALGRRVEPHLPRGPAAGRWRAWMTEAQMLLHEHPVNQAREARGAPPINSVWPWGAGRWRPLPPVPWREVHARHPLARALAQAAGVSLSEPPAGLADLPPGPRLVVLDRLTAPARAGDAPAWRAALEDLDRTWLRPALAALRAGRLGRLVLEGTGAAPRAVELSPGLAWRLWRR